MAWPIAVDIWGGYDGGTNSSPVPPFTTATNGSPTTCFDNAGGSGAQQYSIEQNSGAGLNCALSFRFQ
jgi:hypothetical protein